MLGCGGRKGRCRKRYESRCRKVCWVVGEVRGDVGKGEGSEEMWGSVLGPHPLTHFPTPRDGHSQTLADSESNPNHNCRIQNLESSFQIQNLGG